MITQDTITQRQAKKLVRLVERETRCEIMARLGDLVTEIDYAGQQLEVRDQMRELLFGTSDILELGLKWKLLKSRKKT